MSIQALRNQGKNLFIRMGEVPREAETDPDEGDDDDGEVAARDELVHRALEQIRAQFQAKTWKAFWRTSVDGLSAVEVADELGMSPGAVRVAKSRVLQRLRDELGELIE